MEEKLLSEISREERTQIYNEAVETVCNYVCYEWSLDKINFCSDFDEIAEKLKQKNREKKEQIYNEAVECVCDYICHEWALNKINYCTDFGIIAEILKKKKEVQNDI